MRNKLITVGVIALILLLGFGGWLLTSNKASAPQSSQAPSSGTQATQETSLPQSDNTGMPLTITYRDGGFDKNRYETKAGDKIKVVNDSARTLEFASADHPTHKENPELNLDPLTPGETTMFTVTRTGTWGIHDHNEENLTTTLVVSD